MSRERFFIIDGFANIFRAFYAVRGIDNNAAFGFTTMLKKILESEKPEFAAVAFDTPGPTFRNELYEEYKANRQAMPEGLVPQIPIIKKIVAGFNLPLVEKEGFEADDVIGTLCKQAAEKGLQAVIVSGDKDLLQLVKGDDIVFYDTKKNLGLIDESKLTDYFGCKANQIVDLLTIWGDSSDNIPGVPGVGEKGAKKLLAEYGSLDNIYDHLDEIKRKSYREGFEKARDQIPLTRKLVQIRQDVDVTFDSATYRYEGVDGEVLHELFTKLNFKSLLDNVHKKLKTCERDYPAIDSEDKLKTYIEAIRAAGEFIFDIESTSLDPLDATVVGMALAVDDDHIGYVPLRHEGQDDQWAKTAEDLLKPLFADKDIAKIAHNAKYDISVLLANDWALAGPFDDTMLMSYLITPTDNRHGLDVLAEIELYYKTIHFEDVAGTGKAQVTFDKVPIKQAVNYAAEDADICLRLLKRYRPRLKELGLERVYHEVERPLIPVLARMELRGIRVDKEVLATMSERMQERIDTLEAEIYELAGETFNIKSTKQLGEILFEKLELPVIKKTSKTKSYSTDQSVLEKLAAKGHDLPARLLDYREVTKLKSTYVDALPSLVHARTGRVHSSFNQFVTATGRLSSNNPNLQNIPIRSEMGREIRAAFVPAEGWHLVGADYSQIELRLMAHFSEDKTLVAAFKDGEDIHSRTASEIMDVDPNLVTTEMRAMAKSINFGLIYGMGDFRLAQELNISRKKAREYIEAYFEKMPSVLSFRDKIIEQAKEDGEIRTHFGRYRPLPEIKSRNKNLQNQGERLAVNTLIQGSAAEIIKLAMIALDTALRQEKLRANMLLQVHDELVLECHLDDLDAAKDLLKKTMETVVDFRVPLTVDVHDGDNWKETK